MTSHFSLRFWDSGVGCRHGVDHIRAIAQHVEVGMTAFLAEAGVVGRDDGVAHQERQRVGTYLIGSDQNPR